VKRRFVAVLLALVAFAGTPAFAQADEGQGGANTAIAINTKDGSELFKLAFAIRHVMSDVVDQDNAAVAYASCTSCETTAIAIEIVLVEGSPSTVSPTNVAIAENVQCNLCDTFAAAYQFVIQTSGPVHFTEDGLRELHAIRQEIASWGKDGLTNDQIRALLPDVIARIKKVLETQLVPAGNAEPGQPDESTTTTNEEPTTTTAPPTTTTTTETGGATTTQPPPTTEPTTTTTSTTTEPTTTTTP
jgi:putative peptide zinc metalloprotease protein